MKYKKYILSFSGDPEIVAFLSARVPKRWDRLRDARAKGRAARALLGVDYEVIPVSVPRVEGQVKAL